MTYPPGPQPPSWSDPPRQAHQPPYQPPHQPPYQPPHKSPHQPPRPAQPPGGQVVFELHRANTRKLVIACALYIPLVLSALICGVAEVVNGRTRDGLIALAIGAVLLAVGLVGLLVRSRASIPRRLVIEPAGIRWDNATGQARTVGWPELAAAGLVRHEKPTTGPPTAGQVVVDGVLGKPVLIHLELHPADPTFRQRHPELANLWKKDRLRLQLGFNDHQLPQLEAALRHFLSGRYLGIQQTLAVRRYR